MRQSIIRIKAVIEIAYDRKTYGSASTAEAHCDGIKAALQNVLADAVLVDWNPQHTSVEQ